MTSIVLSNTARSAQELPRQGPDCGPHVYPFFDGHLAHKYRLLVLPAQANRLSVKSINTFDPAKMSLSQCWTSAMVTNYAGTPGQQKRWPFAPTTVLDCSGNHYPTNQGRLPVDDLGEDVARAISQAASAAADPLAGHASSSVVAAPPPPPRPRPQPAPPSSQPLVCKPKITNTRVAVYRIHAPTELKLRIRTFRSRTRLVKNEAIRLVNMATSLSHEHLKERYLYCILANNGSTFTRRHPELLRCPTHTRRQVILKAVAQRKAIITRYGNLPGGHRQPLPVICPVTKQTDKRCGFAVAFPNTTGRIEALYNLAGTKVTCLKLVMPAVTIGGTRYSEIRARICLWGQSQRQSLLSICKRSRPNAYSLPREWRICCAADGRWYLCVTYELMDPAQFKANQRAEKTRGGITVLDGPIKVKSIDPGVRTPFTVYTLEGQTIDIGGDNDRARLCKLRLAADRI